MNGNQSDKYSNGKKLFGDRADRITSKEKCILYSYFVEHTGYLFKTMGTPRHFSDKKTHGDLDIIVVPRHYDWLKRFQEYLGESLLDFHQNDNCYSHLVRSEALERTVHIDIIATFRSPLFITMLQFYSFNDLSAIINVIAKNYGFKYGSRGFFKRYEDTKGNWHDILLSFDMNVGLRCLGFPVKEFNAIRNMEDALCFIIETPFFDHRFFLEDAMTQKNKKDYKRPNIQYMTDWLRKTLIVNNHKLDENVFLKGNHPELFERMNKKIGFIENFEYKKDKYDGNWIMKQFNIESGSMVGDIKTAIQERYGLQYNLIPEDDMIMFVHQFMKHMGV